MCIHDIYKLCEPTVKYMRNVNGSLYVWFHVFSKATLALQEKQTSNKHM